MHSFQVNVLEREEVRLVGLSIVASLNKVIESKVGVKRREELEARKTQTEPCGMEQVGVGEHSL